MIKNFNKKRQLSDVEEGELSESESSEFRNSWRTGSEVSGGLLETVLRGRAVPRRSREVPTEAGDGSLP